jgi:glycosyltransferase involved in cell wall biosynthesis
MSRIWLDTTALLAHTGNPTGCIRVEMEILARLQDFGDWGLFYFDVKTGALAEMGYGSSSESALQRFITFKNSLENKSIRTSKLSLIRDGFFGIKVASLSINEGDVLLSVGIHDQDKFITVAKAYAEMNRAKLAIYVHDIIGVLYPGFFQANNSTYERNDKYFSDISYFSDVVFTNSETTRNDLIRHFGLDNPRIVSLGDSSNSKNMNPIRLACSVPISNSFVMYVSTIEPRKNHQVLVNSYLLAKSLGKLDELPDLYFIGRIGWGTHSWMDTVENDPILRKKIGLFHSVDDEQLEQYYEKALAVVYPSFYEGWGLPVREALSRGKYCLISTGGALSEHINPLVKHLSPWNAEEWMLSILELDLTRIEDFSDSLFQPREWGDFTNELFAQLKLKDADNRVEMEKL